MKDRLFLGLLSFTLVASSLSFGQDSTRAIDLCKCIGTAGIGISSEGLSLGMCGSYLFGNTMLSARIISNGKGGQFGPQLGNRATDISLLVGRFTASDHGMASFSVGLGGMNGVGLAVGTHLFLCPSPFWGIGLYGFGNLVSRGSGGGVLLAVQFGSTH